MEANNTRFIEPHVIEKARLGCEYSFQMIFEQYYPAIHSYAWKLCGTESVADDIAQQTFIKVAQNLANCLELDKFNAWIYRIALNTARDHFRSSQRYQQRLQAYDPPQMQETSGYIEQETISECLNNLPTIIQETVLLVFAQGFTQKEAAEVLDCPAGTVAWRISEARRLIKQFNCDTQTA